MPVKRTINAAAQAHLKQLTSMNTAVAKVGWFAGNDYKNGTPVAYVAAIQEFGSPQNNIPPRPFMRPTIDSKQTRWRNLFASLLRQKIPIGAAMEKVGGVAAGDFRKAITEVLSPKLKLATIKARLSGKQQGKFVSLNVAKPLEDTGQMKNTLIHKVEVS